MGSKNNMKRLICVPFAYDTEMKSGVNISVRGGELKVVFKECVCSTYNSQTSQSNV